MLLTPTTSRPLGLTAAALLLTASGPAWGQSEFAYDFQIPASQRATFNTSGAATLGDMQGDAFLSSVVYPDDSEYTEYYSPVNVWDLYGQAGQGKKIKIRGGSNITDGVPGQYTLGGYATDSSSNTITDDDVDAFEDTLREVLANKNLNNYFDMSGSPDFGFTISFELPVMDDDPDNSDVRGELLFFERGSGGGNSWLTMQAVDEDGNALGPALAISPEETYLTSPEFAVLNSSQKIGGLAVDVSRLGVSEVQHLRVRRTTTSDDGYTPVSRGGVDFQPDFKLMAVITHPEHLTLLQALYD
ncbi:MAG: hypothetical protein AAF911_10645 [Planctomycetota bacterium]